MKFNVWLQMQEIGATISTGIIATDKDASSNIYYSLQDGPYRVRSHEHYVPSIKTTVKLNKILLLYTF